VIKRYFRDYDECLSNDFVLSGGGRDVELLRTDIDDWRITFVDTGLTANIGERLFAVRRHLQDEEAFLVNYADGVTDLPLPQYLDRFRRSSRLARSSRSNHRGRSISSTFNQTASCKVCAISATPVCASTADSSRFAGKCLTTCGRVRSWSLSRSNG